MAMAETVRELNEVGAKLMKTAKQKLVEAAIEDVTSFDPEVYELMFDAFRLYDLSMKLVKEQAETMEEINNKLNKLLERKEKES